MRIFEVGPRDGLQNERKILNLKQKEDLIQQLLASGLRDIEIGSFVRRDAIPQLADTDKLLKRLLPKKQKKWPEARLWAFVPNEIGLENAVLAGSEGFSFFAATSETFAKKNVNRNHKKLRAFLSRASQSLPRSAKKRIYLSTLVFCPFEGNIPVSKVFSWIDFLLERGFHEISLSDTTGHALPSNLKTIFQRLSRRYNLNSFSLHYHDTRGTALLNTYCAMDFGFRSFDSSLGGAGGCPYAPGATGNLATEDLVYFLQSQSHMKDISLKKISQASFRLERQLGKSLPSRVLQTLRYS